MRFFLAFSFLPISLFLWSATAKSPFSNFSVNDGLAQSVVYALFQDHDGYLWMGTQAGVSRFDGRSFRNFNTVDGLAHNVVRVITQTSDGSLLFGTERGITRYDGLGFSLLANEDKSPAPDSIRCLIEARDGSLWGGSFEQGVFHYKDGRYELFNMQNGLPGKRARAILEDSQGRIWVGLYGTGIGYFQDGVWTFFPEQYTRENRFVRVLFELGENHILFGTNFGLFQIKDEVISPYGHHDFFVDNSVSDIVRDKNGGLWVGTTRAGAAHLRGESLEIYDIARGMSNNGIQSILLDNEKKVWFGTYGGGVCRLGRSNFLNYTTQAGFSYDNVYALLEDSQGHIWMGTNGGGLSRLANDSFSEFTQEDGLLDNKILALAEDREGTIWIGTLQGVSFYKDGRFTSLTQENGLPHNTVYGVKPTRDGRIWFATFDGLSVFDGRGFLSFDSKQGLPADRVHTLYEDEKQQLWVGTAKGVGIIHNDRVIRTYTLEDGLVGDFISQITSDSKGRIWISSTQGVSCFREDGFQSYTTENGLSSPICNVVLEDDQGYLWIGTSNGLNRFDGESFTVFTHRDGLTSNEINRGAGLKDNSGNLWFGTTAGVTMFRSAEPTPLMPPPNINITDVKILGESRTHQLPLALAHDENYLQFQFTGISFSDPTNILYNYKLEGSDPEWIASSAGTAAYNRLPPGRYRFLVKARNADGVWSQTPAGVSFIITPPIWKRAWFVGLLILAVVGLILLKIRSLKVQNAILERKVDERTAELAASNRKLESLALNDQLTGARNRHYLDLIMPGELSKLKRIFYDSGPYQPASSSMGVAMLDLDLFKSINDEYGHDTGDLVLKTLADTLKHFIREVDTLIRWGGEEFLIVFQEITFEDLQELCERLRDHIAQTPFEVQPGKLVRITASIGYCIFPLDRDPTSFAWEKVLKLADAALYEAKQRGRNLAVGVEATGPRLSEIFEAIEENPTDLGAKMGPCLVTI